MALERDWERIGPISLTSNGTTDGVVNVSSASGFYVKQIVTLKSTTLQPRTLQVKRVLPTQIIVGPVSPSMTVKADISDFLVTDSATIEAAQQEKPNVPKQDQDKYSYAHEPANARRVLGVDEFGRPYNSNNPLPVDATVSVVVPPVSVDLDGYDQANPDSVNITGSDNGLKTGVKRGARVDSDFDLRVALSNGANKALVNLSGELSTVDAQTRTKLDSIITQLAATLNTSDTTAHSLLTTIIAGLVSIDAGIPAALGQTTMANSMPVNIASDQTPIPISGSITATLGDEPIKISGTENGQPNGPEFPIVNNRVQQILKAKDRAGTISYADFGTKDQRITEIRYTAPSIGAGPGFTAVKTFTYTLVGTRYRRDTPGDWSIV